MPTAAKLFAAFVFAAVAFFAANAVIPLMPEGTQVNLFVPISTGIGMLSGWFIAGRLAGRGYRSALGGGFQSSIVMLFWCLVVFSVDEMINKAVRLSYSGPLEAVTDVFTIGLELGQMVMVPDVLFILVAGGFLGGAFTEWASRRWS